MNGPSLLARWHAGKPASSFTPAEAEGLANHLMERGWSVYSDRKHPDHAALSAEVAELRAVAAPGFLGPGGEVMAGAAHPETLF
ncbi:hypothetical protein [Methylibium petroleiphilum]|uniref:hypothetical protein n=1 Tax=Methylibium petroleiphilum TaxID=105560 RepID=UPI003D2BECFC